MLTLMDAEEEDRQKVGYNAIEEGVQKRRWEKVGLGLTRQRQ